MFETKYLDPVLKDRSLEVLVIREDTKSGKELLRFLHTHCADRITVSELAAHAGVSEKECIRSFKAMFHQTPMDYLSRYRVGQAMRLLREGELPVTQIAFQCGFQSSAYFTKVFRQQQGVTPTQFRRQHTKTQP